MKRNLINIFLGLTLLLPSCSEGLRVDLDVPGVQDYINVYMPQAYDYPRLQNVFVSDETQSFIFSACYGGPEMADKDIKVRFEVLSNMVENFNLLNNTAYPMMPQGSYELETLEANIKAGTNNTGPLKINIMPAGKMQSNSSYLLPVCIMDVDGETKLNEEYKITYFLITGSFEPGNVPREKVLSFGVKDVGLLFCKNEELIRRDVEGNMLLYQPGEDGIFGDSRQFGSGWQFMDILFYMPYNRILGRDAPSTNINQYIIDDNYNFLGQRTIGWGWGDFSDIIPFKDLMVLALTPDGDIRKFPLNQNGDWDYGNIISIGDGFNIYTHVFSYQSSLITIDEAGNMWQIPMTDDGVLSSKRSIGTGWDMYVKVICCNTDLLALDENGDLWRYKFDPNYFWPLK